ncbi:MAG: enoyl-CoA hydratase-related protein [Planctomycetes bacterium]|nr:enoyl-CoA hydratase-related protein [Planctomycetota bacterium]
MSYETIKYEIDGSTAVITLSRPEVLNALNSKLLGELAEAVEKAAADENVRGVILTGEGKAFAAGADISEMKDQPGLAMIERAKRGQALLARIENLGKPVVAAVNGFALGGGCEISMACTFRTASTKAKFGQPEVKLGIIPGYGGTQRLVRLVGMGRAMELMITGDMITADEALRIGLVNYVFEPEELLPKTKEIIAKAAANGPIAVKYAMLSAMSGASMDLKSALEYEATLFGICAGTADKQEGMAAFLEKRAAKFTGK